MELFSTLSDDQIALLGCATALVTTGTLMCLSYFLGRGRMSQPVPHVGGSSQMRSHVSEASEHAKRRSAA